MCKYEMDPASIVEDTEQTFLSTDAPTDGQSETSKQVNPPQFRSSGEYDKCPLIHCRLTKSDIMRCPSTNTQRNKYVIITSNVLT